MPQHSVTLSRSVNTGPAPVGLKIARNEFFYLPQ
jgi:hypothetical protein